MREVEILIVGGGMAGLGAARTLVEQGVDDFLLVTKDVGGRMVTSVDGETNYGAFYVRADYKYILPLVTREQQLRVRDTAFFREGKRLEILSWRNLSHLPSALRGIWLLWKFAHHYRALQRRCETMSPVLALAEDPWGERLYEQSAPELVREYGLEFWSEYFLHPIIRATAFVDMSQISAAHMLTCLLPIIIPSWEFKFDMAKMLQPIADHVQREIVIVSMYRENNQWIAVDENQQEYRARHLIMALPIHDTKRLLSLNEPTNEPIKAIVVHVRGELKKEYQRRRLLFFSADSRDLWISEEDGNTYLFYTQNNQYDLAQYFNSFVVIREQRWDPAFFLGSHITEIDRGNNLYIIGGHNFASMEDAYVSGIYAAQKLVQKYEEARRD